MSSCLFPSILRKRGRGPLWAPTGVFVLAAVAWAARPASLDGQIVIAGLESERFIEARVEGDLILLRTEDGRLYSVARSAVDLEALQKQASPLLQELVELVRAGVSERIIKAYVENQWSRQARLQLTKNDVIALKNAGASDGLVEYLLRGAGHRPKTTTIHWSTPSRPPGGEEASRQPRPAAPETMEAPRGGIPYYPYVFPGFGAYLSYVPGRGYTGFAGSSTEGSDVELQGPPDNRGYYRPHGRSISGRSSRAQRTPASPRFRTGPRGSRSGPRGQWQRGGAGRRRGRRAEAASSAPVRRGAAPLRPSGSSWTGTRSSALGSAPPRTGSSSPRAGRSLSGRSTTRSSSGRSLGKKK